MACSDCSVEAKNQEDKKALYLLLAINFSMFIAEGGIGLWAESTGLIADSLDMLADAFVYGLSLYAVAGSAQMKSRAAKFSGYFQMALAILVLSEVLRRFIYGSEPVSAAIMLMGGVALIANIVCLRIISKQRGHGVHMEASYIFSKNDVIANTGVILAGLLVWLTGSALPDLIIGLVISCVVMKGGWDILKAVEKTQEQAVSAR